MASSQNICDICHEQHKTSLAVIWCAECEERLCETCKQHHNVAKLTKKHDTIAIETFDQLPEFAKEMKNECSDHELRFEYFCSGHDTLCCVQCLRTTHIECRSISPMHEVIKREKSMAALEEIENVFKDLTSNIDLLINDRRDNLESLADQKDQCMKKIEEVRNNILLTVDKLVKALQTELEGIYTKKTSTIEDAIDELEAKKETINTLVLQNKTIRDSGSELQMFHAFSAFQTQLSNEESYVMSATQLDSAKHTEILFTHKGLDTLEKILLEHHNVFMKENSCRVTIYGRRAKQAQLLSVSRKNVDVSSMRCTPMIENIPTNPSSKNQNVFSNCFLGKGRFACCDIENKQLIIYRDNCTVDYNIQLSIAPVCIAQLDDFQIVVTNRSQKLYVVNIDTRTVSVLLEMDETLCSVSIHSKGFCFRAGYRWFYVTDFSGKMLYKVKFIGENILSATFADEKMYFTQWSTDKVHCCNLSGQVIWEFNNKALKAPVDISIYANVLFITGFHSSNVVALQNDGKNYQVLYENTSMANNTRSVSYDNNKLLVTTVCGKIYLLKLTF